MSTEFPWDYNMAMGFMLMWRAQQPHPDREEIRVEGYLGLFSANYLVKQAENRTELGLAALREFMTGLDKRGFSVDG